MKLFQPSFLSSYYLRRGFAGSGSIKTLAIDIFAIAVIASVIIFFSLGENSLHISLSDKTYQEIDLSINNIPYYAFHTTFRMLVAIIVSIIFSIIYATIAAKSKRMEEILIPFLDILQSVPVLGYVSFTISAFMTLAPSTVFGLEMAVIFAIFTSQAWNLTFGIYQSLKSIPIELEEAAITFKMNKWQKFWRLELPFCIPNMVWNMTVSMAGGWFFVVASESIAVGVNIITLPGIGSSIALALAQQNWYYLYMAVFAMGSVIIIYNFIIFNPLIVWSDKFRYEMTKSDVKRSNLIVDIFSRSITMRLIGRFVGRIADFLIDVPFMNYGSRKIELYRKQKDKQSCIIDIVTNIIWYILLVICGFYLIWYIYHFMNHSVSLDDIKLVSYFVSMTFIRVVSLIFLVSIILVPVGIYIGINPKLTVIVQPIIQFLASFPANLFFPFVVIYITKYNLDPNIWLSPLVVSGSMWYILFNTMSGASQIPTEMREVYKLFGIKKWLWWKKVAFPAVLPGYVTGAITASGGAWNASIIAEAVTWGDTHLFADGIGSYIARTTASGDFPHIALGIITMSLVVVLFNKIFWQPLYNYTTKKYSY